MSGVGELGRRSPIRSSQAPDIEDITQNSGVPSRTTPASDLKKSSSTSSLSGASLWHKGRSESPATAKPETVVATQSQINEAVTEETDQPIGKLPRKKDFEAYKGLENEFSAIFNSNKIATHRTKIQLPSGSGPCPMGQTVLAIVPPGKNYHIYTEGLAVCIGIGGRGIRSDGSTVLAMHHYSGSRPDGSDLSESEAMNEVYQALLQHGVGHNDYEILLAGGQLGRLDTSSNSLREEEMFLEMSDRYNITGSKTHWVVARFDDDRNKVGINRADFAIGPHSAVVASEGFVISQQ